MSLHDGLGSDDELDVLFTISENEEGALSGQLHLGKEWIREQKEIAEQIAAAWRNPRFRERMESFRRSVRLGEPAFAVANTPLPDGAAVAVVRDPSGAPTRLIVVAKGAPESEVQLGRSTLRQSEIVEPDISARTVILRWVDGRYAIMHHGVVDRTGMAAWRYRGRGTPTVDTRDVAASGDAPLQVPELGPVKIVRQAAKGNP
jgi:hypothetical protein